MNLQEARGLFIAQYLGQDGIYADSERDLLTCVTTDDIQSAIDGRCDSDYLLLRSVSQLTDEEKLMLCKMQLTQHVLNTLEIKRFYHYNLIPCLQFKFLNEEREDVLGRPGYMHSEVSLFNGGDYNNATNEQISIMKSLGILLPFTYIDEEFKPITLSIEEIIKLSWAKFSTK